MTQAFGLFLTVQFYYSCSLFFAWLLPLWGIFLHFLPTFLNFLPRSFAKSSSLQCLRRDRSHFHKAGIGKAAGIIKYICPNFGGQPFKERMKPIELKTSIFMAHLRGPATKSVRICTILMSSSKCYTNCKFAGWLSKAANLQSLLALSHWSRVRVWPSRASAADGRWG